MRKSKDIKRKRKEAGIEYHRGNRQNAYKMWAEAKKERDELRASAKAAPAGEGEAAAS